LEAGTQLGLQGQLSVQVGGIHQALKIGGADGYGVLCARRQRGEAQGQRRWNGAGKMEFGFHKMTVGFHGFTFGLVGGFHNAGLKVCDEGCAANEWIRSRGGISAVKTTPKSVARLRMSLVVFMVWLLVWWFCFLVFQFV
jgi:hypothetical protein